MALKVVPANSKEWYCAIQAKDRSTFSGWFWCYFKIYSTIKSEL